MALTYQTSSIIESFDLQAALGETLSLCIYGASWQGSQFLSDPTAALSAVNDAMDSVSGLQFSGIQILSALNSLGQAMVFCVVDPVYNGKVYINPSDVPTLRNAVANALNTGDTGLYLTYSDIIIGTSQSGT